MTGNQTGMVKMRAEYQFWSSVILTGNQTNNSVIYRIITTQKAV
ncbi:hypothetical protein ATORI0001_1513 [Lancefieldella rimae ATCC 49626]|uniref:Uncharacterized protein n=1 Tax=Lancefieldella rimae (strain ATCC 49626 / DSM 7090 / CCUG 31168 / NBRC 15546 / VPI D140H-11A) TaxID=553184 RepID=B9CMH1_LANR4|nr:hypothetical protein ATORI0001_1513 [Lancefieldella rimae ATCC 49626]